MGRVLIAIAAMFYGVEHFLHPLNAPGVPLQKMMPAWIPGRLLIGYLTGAILLVAGRCILLGKKTRMAATYLGTWIVLLVAFHLWADPDSFRCPTRALRSRLRGSTTSSTRCCLPERFSRSPARRHATLKLPERRQALASCWKAKKTHRAGKWESRLALAQ